jgi:hypothetical protein
MNSAEMDRHIPFPFPGGAFPTHITHVLAFDPTLATLATLPPGHLAERESPGDEWQISAHSYGL